MSWAEWGLAAVFAFPAIALAFWIRLLRRELKEQEEKEKIH